MENENNTTTDGIPKSDKQHSIEVSRTSAGKYSYSVKMYYADILEADKILEEVERIENLLNDKYRNEVK